MKSHIEREHHLDNLCARALRVALHSLFHLLVTDATGDQHCSSPTEPSSSWKVWHSQCKESLMSFNWLFPLLQCFLSVDFSIYCLPQTAGTCLDGLEVCSDTVIAEIFVCDAIYIYKVALSVVLFATYRPHAFPGAAIRDRWTRGPPCMA